MRSVEVKADSGHASGASSAACRDQSQLDGAALEQQKVQERGGRRSGDGVEVSLGVCGTGTGSPWRMLGFSVIKWRSDNPGSEPCASLPVDVSSPRADTHSLASGASTRRSGHALTVQSTAASWLLRCTSQPVRTRWPAAPCEDLVRVDRYETKVYGPRTASHWLHFCCPPTWPWRASWLDISSRQDYLYIS